MNKQYKIKNSCDQSWDDMLDAEKNKFCTSCSKTVFNLDGKNDLEIKSLISKHQNICGKFSMTTINTAASLLLALSLTVISCKTSTISTEKLEKSDEKIILINGNIDKDTVQVYDLKVRLITKEKLYKAEFSNEYNFTLKIPESALKDINLLKIDYSFDRFKRTENSSSLHLLSKKELLNNKKLVAENGFTYIGEVVIITPEPPDFYYFNGKKISSRLYEKLLKENPTYNEIVLYDDIYKKVITSEYCDTINLLYSK